MNRTFPGWLRRGPCFRAIALALSTLVVYVAVAPLAAWLGSWDGVVAAGVAALLCLAGAEMAMLVCLPFQNTTSLWIGALMGMLPRLGIPFAFGVILFLLSRPLAEAGLLYYLVGFYPVTLALETALVLRG